MTDGGKYCQNIFQSTLLQEERLSSIKMEKSHIISIHAPTRGATDKAVEGILNILNFNPRSYKRSDLDHLHHGCFHLLFQSTLLQEERRVILTPFTFDLVLISIHAPTRGATKKEADCVISEFISIHAPTRGATHTARFRRCDLQNFNPRSYKRSDVLQL